MGKTSDGFSLDNTVWTNKGNSLPRSISIKSAIALLSEAIAFPFQGELNGAGKRKVA